MPVVVVADTECIKVCINALTESVYVQFISTLLDKVYSMEYIQSNSLNRNDRSKLLFQVGREVLLKNFVIIFTS